MAAAAKEAGAVDVRVEAPTHDNFFCVDLQVEWPTGSKGATITIGVECDGPYHFLTHPARKPQVRSGKAFVCACSTRGPATDTKCTARAPAREALASAYTTVRCRRTHRVR